MKILLASRLRNFFRHKHRRIIFWLLLPLITGSGLVWLTSGREPPSYLTEILVLGDIENVVLASGILQPIKKVEVGAQVSGQLKSLKVKLGERVAKGQLMAEIDPSLALTDQKIALAELDGLLAQRRGVRAKLLQAQEERIRQDKLRMDQAGTEREWRRAWTDRSVLSAELAELEARISRSRLLIDRQRTELAYRQITAPMAGEVLSITTKEGQTVIAAQQAPHILTLGDLARMEVLAQVSEADILSIRKGQRAYFSLLGSNEVRHYGVVREIQPGAEKINNAMFYSVLFDVDNPDRGLRTDMTAQVGIVLGEAKQSLLLPMTALGQKYPDGRYAVRVLATGGVPEQRKVSIGIKGRTHAQVLDGVRAGERVITSAPEDAGSGATVTMG